MTAISLRQPEVDIEYDSRRGSTTRLRKHFKDAYDGKTFYMRMLKEGRNPKVVKPGTSAQAVSVPVSFEGDTEMPKSPTTATAAKTAKPAKAAKTPQIQPTGKKVVGKKVATNPAAPKKAAAKTEAPATKAKKATPPAAAPKAAKNESGLRKPQVRVLEALVAAGKGLNRREISENAKVDLAMLNAYIGAHDEAKRKHNDETFCPSLLTLGLITYAPAENEEAKGSYYKATAAGRKLVEKLNK